jgi:hypothetical protein
VVRRKKGPTERGGEYPSEGYTVTTVPSNFVTVNPSNGSFHSARVSLR